MKKCYYFPTWVDISENVCISCDEKSIYVQPNEMFLVRRGDKFISLWHDDLVSCDTRYEDDAISNDCLDISKVHHAYTINGFKYEEDSLIPITSNTLGDAKRFTKSTPSDPILAKLCELTGAKMYGDYVVFVDKVCDIFSENCNCLNHYGKLLFLNKDIYVFTPADDLHPNNNRDDIIKQIFTFNTEGGYCPFTQDVIEPHARFYCNIFQEYSKFLRNEENKWEEVKKIVL